MKRVKVNFNFKSMALALFALVLSSNVWGETYTASAITQTSDLEDGGLYIILQDGHVLINVVTSDKAQTSNTYSTTNLSGTETYVWKFIAADTKWKLQSANASSYYMSYKTGSNNKGKMNYTTTGNMWTITYANSKWKFVDSESRFLGYTGASTYEYKTYASGNYDGGSYPNNISILKLTSAGPSCTTPPTVSAGSASDATTSSLTFNCSGGITSLGSAGCSITEYGYVYGTSENPTTSNTKHKVGESYTTTGTAFAAYTATGLNCGTTYYMRPYAINGNSTAYGARVSLATLDCPVDHFVDKVQGYAQQDKQGNGYTIPSCGDKTKGTGCEGEHYKFIGWSSTQIQAGTQPTEPSGLLKAGGKHDATGATYYAVWAKEQ